MLRNIEDEGWIHHNNLVFIIIISFQKKSSLLHAMNLFNIITIINLNAYSMLLYLRLSLNKKEAKEEEFNFYGCIMTIMSIHRAYMGVLLKYNAAGRDFTTKSKHLHISLVRANVLQ